MISTPGHCEQCNKRIELSNKLAENEKQRQKLYYELFILDEADLQIRKELEEV